MKILILGANGFIGNALTKKLLEKTSNEVYAMDLSNNKLDHSISNPRFHFIEGDINISNEWIEYNILKCDVIIPLVAIATPNVYVTDPLKVFQLDFESNLKVIKLVAKYHKRLIFPSTSETYGMCEDEKFNEYTSKLVLGPIHKCRWIYSASKQLLDRVITAYAQKNDLTCTIFRPFNWVGPKLDSMKEAQLGNGRVITIFLYNLIHGKDIVLVNGGKQRRSFTYLEDGIEALIKIIEMDSTILNEKIFNIGNPNNDISISMLADIMVDTYNQIMDVPYKGNIISKSENEFYGKGYEDIPVRVPDISEAKIKLLWKPKNDINQTIKKTMIAYLKDEGYLTSGT
jgi:nucleoside-diphosphate-sugar epimerase